MRIPKTISHFPDFTLTVPYRIHSVRQLTKAAICVALLAGACMRERIHQPHNKNCNSQAPTTRPHRTPPPFSSGIHGNNYARRYI
jgi:hypothetical protein